MRDEALFILVTMGFVMAPALLMVPLALFTCRPPVKRALWRGFVAFALIPPLQAALYVLMNYRCAEGHLDAAFRGCGPVLDPIARISYVFFAVPLGVVGVLFCLHAARLHLAGHRSGEGVSGDP